MSFVKIVFGLLVVLSVGGFVYFSLTDIPVEKTTITKTIDNERFF